MLRAKIRSDEAETATIRFSLKKMSLVKKAFVSARRIGFRCVEVGGLASSRFYCGCTLTCPFGLGVMYEVQNEFVVPTHSGIQNADPSVALKMKWMENPAAAGPRNCGIKTKADANCCMSGL